MSSTWVVSRDAPDTMKSYADDLYARGYAAWVCDGVADEIEILEALRSLPRGQGGSTELSPGGFHVASPVDLNLALEDWPSGALIGKVTLTGDGRESTYLRPAATMERLIDMQADKRMIRNVVLERFGLHDPDGLVSFAGIHTGGASAAVFNYNNTLKDLRAYGFQVPVIYGIQSIVTTITDCAFPNLNGGIGVELTGGGLTTATITRVYVSGKSGGVATPATGFILAGTGHRVRDCTLEDLKQGIDVTSRYGGGAEAFDIMSTYFENNYQGDIKAQGLPGSRVRGGRIAGNLHASGETAYAFYHAEGIHIEGNTVRPFYNNPVVIDRETTSDITFGPNYGLEAWQTQQASRGWGTPVGILALGGVAVVSFALGRQLVVGRR